MAAVDPINCRGLTKRFGSFDALRDVDLTVAAGTVTGFLGANGAGKSTLIRIVMDLLRPTVGEVLLWGEPASAAATRSRVGYMPADPAFYLPLTGDENLDLLAQLRGHGSPDREMAAGLLELPGAVLRRPVREYSSGMVQKLALVQAVQHRPDLVILDEPANRLDPLAHRRFEQLVRGIADAGRTVFLSSHTLSEVEDVCDTVAMIRAGRLLAVQSVAALSAAAPRQLHAVFSRPPARLPAGLIAPQLHDGELTAGIPRGAKAVLQELLALDELVDVTVEPSTLEDTFVELYDTGAASS